MAISLTHTRPQAGAHATLDKKIEHAIKIIRLYAKHNTTLAYSGGKDSDVLLFLMREAGVSLPIIHHVTTIDPPGTIAHCQQVGATIIRPKLSWLQIVEKKGFPTMNKRFCCSMLKEFYDSPYQLLGIRACESNKRKARYVEPTACRIYTKFKETEQVFPILNFTDEDVAAIVNSCNIKCHPLYYDESGNFHVERRLGCIGCPLQGDRGRADYLQYPILFRQYMKRWKQYCENHNIKDVYLPIVKQLFYSNHGEEKFRQNFYGLFPAPNPKDLLQDYFKIEIP